MLVEKCLDIGKVFGYWKSVWILEKCLGIGSDVLRIQKRIRLERIVSMIRLHSKQVFPDIFQWLYKKYTKYHANIF